MAEILRVVAITLAAVIAVVIVRQHRPDIATQLSLAAGLGLFGLVLWRVEPVLETIVDLGDRAGMRSDQLLLMVRAVGIAYLAEFASSVCRDAGESALASKVELAGKVLILLLALPVVLAVFELVFQLLT